MIKVNGIILNDINEISLYDYLISASYDLNSIAVELNGNIIPKCDYKNTFLYDNNNLEVVSFVGGG